MPELVYRFDGSFAGLLCCIYECYTRRERVIRLEDESDPRMSLEPVRLVETDEAHAKRVYASLRRSLGSEGLLMVQYAFMCSADDKDETVFRFIELGYSVGPVVVTMLHDPVVIRLNKLYRAVWNEMHHYMGFVRFAQYYPRGDSALPMLPESKNALVSIIEPKHNVLPLLSEHFCDRFPEERFIIYDKQRGLALVYRPYRAEFASLEGLELPDDCTDGQLFERLWKGYYEAVAIEARRNEPLRQSHMPKRFWNHLVELQQEGMKRLP